MNPAARAVDRLTAARVTGAVDLLELSRDPRLQRPAVISVRGWRCLVADPVAELQTLDELSAFAEDVGWRDEPSPVGPPLRRTAVGFVTDDLSPSLLGLAGDQRPAVAPLPRLRFGVHDWTVSVAPDGSGWIVADNDRLPALRRWVESAAPASEPAPVIEPVVAGAGLTRRAHGERVAQVLEWIARGDLYQANLTFQVAVRWGYAPQTLARRLWSASPNAAHAAMLVVDGDTAVVSASPETFLRTDGDWVTTRPIKGTRPRLAEAGRDAEQARRLQRSAKDHAEHLMIVDLARNDLGRVSRPGTVHVPRYATTERHPTLWHLTSTVRGRMRRDVTLADLLAATFPPGSVTGAPKRMAVQRTTLIEPVRRGVYCGAIGVVSRGLVDLSVAIRTAVLSRGTASYGAGGGIVADSRAASEYQEALDKAAAFLRATRAGLGQPRRDRTR